MSEMKLKICFKDYVSSGKVCQKTTIPEEVTCLYCIGRLIERGKLKTKED